MVQIIELDKDGKRIGTPKSVTNEVWENLLRFGNTLRWEEVKQKKGKRNERKKRSDIGNAVEKAN